MADAAGASAATEPQNSSTTMAATAAAEVEMGSAVYVRWINSKKGSVLAVPQEWLDAPVGRVFAPTTAKASS